MPSRSNDPRSLQEFVASLGARDPKAVATYLTTVRDFVAWLALQPGGKPFHLGLVTETAVRGYLDFLAATKRAPRNRSKSLSALLLPVSARGRPSLSQSGPCDGAF